MSQGSVIVGSARGSLSDFVEVNLFLITRLSVVGEGAWWILLTGWCAPKLYE